MIGGLLPSKPLEAKDELLAFEGGVEGLWVAPIGGRIEAWLPGLPLSFDCGRKITGGAGRFADWFTC